VLLKGRKSMDGLTKTGQYFLKPSRASFDAVGVSSSLKIKVSISFYSNNTNLNFIRRVCKFEAKSKQCTQIGSSIENCV
jgi:hypothetical protein